MGCEMIEVELVAYHFGAATDEARRQVEAHLVACTRCVGRYLAVKRALEDGEEGEARPSEIARARLFAAARVELARLRRASWRRRLILPLATATAAAAIALGVLALRHASVVAPAGGPVDTALTVAASEGVL